jgi:hypothetical protein
MSIVPYLLCDTCFLPAKYGIPSQQASKEAVKPSLLPSSRGVNIPQYEHSTLVYEGKGCEVSGMLACGFQNKQYFLSEAV